MLACFSSKWAQNVHIFKGYHNPVASSSNQLGCMQFFISEKPELATDGLVACGLVQSGFGFFLVHRTGPSKATTSPNSFVITR